MKLSRKIVAAAVAAGILATGVVAVAEPGRGGCGDRPAMTRDGGFDPAAMADRRLSRLKSDLQVTPEQETLWQSFAEKAKGEAGRGKAAMREQAKDASLTAPERMSRTAELMKQRVAAMESVNEAFAQLYAGLTSEQRKFADEHAARMGHGGFERTGHHGHWGRRAPPAEPTKG